MVEVDHMREGEEDGGILNANEPEAWTIFVCLVVSSRPVF